MFNIGFFFTQSIAAEYDKTAAVAFSAAGTTLHSRAVPNELFGLNSGQAFAGVVRPLVEVPCINFTGSRLIWLRKKYFDKSNV